MVVSKWSFRLLGPIEVLRDDEEVPIGPAKQRALLAALLLDAGQAIATQRLVDLLWNSEPPSSAKANLRTYVTRLRSALVDRGTGTSRLVRRKPGYLVVTEPAEVDLAVFGRLAAEGRAALAKRDLGRAEESLGEAMALWRGTPGEDVANNGDLLAARFANVDELRLCALEDYVDTRLAQGVQAELVPKLRAEVALHPMRERLQAQLMLALHRSGDFRGALAVFDSAAETFGKRLGGSVPSSLVRLQRSILDRHTAVDLDHPAVVEQARIMISRDPQWTPTVPRERDGATTSESRDNQDANGVGPWMLPAALGDFTGRRVELAAIEAVFGEDRGCGGPAAAVTVSGPAGIGKTTLSVQAAHRLRSVFGDGQLYAMLAGARAQPVDTAVVLGRFLRALGVPASAVPDDPEERAERYRSLLAGRRILVVLDDAFDEKQLAPLMPASGTCGVIVTGRVRLGGLGGARRIELDEMSEADSLALLSNSMGYRLAGANQADLSGLVRLCARLPLALRIAGSLLVSRPHWRLSDLVSRLADERHRLDALRYRDLDVRASVGMSYDGLRPEARRLFRLLGLLQAPDFPLWAAAAALDTEPNVAHELLDELVDVHLLKVTWTSEGQTRYGFNDLIRAFARERADDEDPPTSRHVAVVRALSALLALTDIADRGHMGQDLFRQDA